jgi:capsular polysaccharide biosynthesis protein
VLPRGTSLIEIKAESDDPNEAAAIANSRPPRLTR